MSTSYFGIFESFVITVIFSDKACEMIILSNGSLCMTGR